MLCFNVNMLIVSDNSRNIYVVDIYICGINVTKCHTSMTVMTVMTTTAQLPTMGANVAFATLSTHQHLPPHRRTPAPMR